MEKLLYLIGGITVGFVMCYLFFRDGSVVFECEPKKHLVQYCADSAAINYKDFTEIDNTLNGFYRASVLNGEIIGFSLDKDLIRELNGYLSIDPLSHGIRLYPGQDGANKLVLIKPLDNQGNERIGIGKALPQSNVLGLSGPCPRWCGEAGRIILSQPPPPPSSNE